MRMAVLVIILFILFTTQAFAGSTTLSEGANKPQEGATLANFSLTFPKDAGQAAYLGLEPQNETFTLRDIRAKALLIEIFSMYCPFCQEEAPAVNDFYQKLRESAQDQNLKMLGIGTGNSDYEVDVFRDKYQVAMPLFSDLDFSVYNTIGQVGTPFFMLVRAAPQGDGLEILKVHEGAVKDMDAFYTEILDRVENLQ